MKVVVMVVRLIKSVIPYVILSVVLVSAGCTGDEKKEVETFRLAPSPSEHDKGEQPKPPKPGPQSSGVPDPNLPSLPHEPSREEKPGLTRSQAETLNYSRILGQRNLKNTCFANAVHKLLLADGRFSDPSLAHKPLQREFFSFLQKMESGRQSLLQDPHKIRPEADFFEGALKSIFNSLTSELLASSKTRDVSFFYPSELMKDQVDAYDYYQKLIEVLELPKLSPGFFWSTQIRFRSGDVNQSVHSLDELFALELPMEQPAVTSIQEALAHTALPTEMSGSNLVINERTRNKEVSDQYGYMTLAPGKTAPQQIVLALKRFQMDHAFQKTKLTRAVEPSATVQADFFSRDLTQKVTVQYKLKAVVVQVGALDSGHYIAYTLQTPGDLGGKWVLHDDAYVSPLSDLAGTGVWEQVRTNGYLFLYGQ